MIYVDLQPFAKESIVYVINEQEQRKIPIDSDMRQAATFTVGLAHSLNDYNVKLRIAELKDLILEAEKIAYKENELKIKVEVEGE